MAALFGAGNVTTAGATGNVNTLAISVPTNRAVGHMLFVAFTFQNGDSTRLVVPPAGGEWTQFGEASPMGFRPMQVFGRPITTVSGLPTSYTFTTTSSAGRAAAMAWLDDDVDFTTPDAGASGWGTLSTGPTAPAFTATQTDATIYLVAYTNTAANNGVPVGTVTGLTKVGVGISQAGAGSPQASTTVSVFTADSSTTSQPARTPSFTPAPTSTGSVYQFAVKQKTVAPTNPTVSIMRGVGAFQFAVPAVVDVLYSPTPTTSTAVGVSSTSGATLVPPTDSRFKYRGAGGFAYGTDPGTTTFYAPNSRYAYTWGTPGSFGCEFVFTGRVLEIYFRYNGGATGMARLRVNGQRVTALASSVGATSAGFGHVWKIDFGTSATRTIRLESASMPFGGIYLAPGDSLSAGTTPTRRLAVLGDSISGGSDVNTGAGQGTWVQRFASYAGCDDAWNLSIGGSGYIVDGQGVKFQTRVPDVTTSAAQYVIVWGGYNDGAVSLTSAANTLYAAIKAALPNAQLYVIGMWHPSNTGGSTTRDDELRAAAAASGCPFISLLSGNVYDRYGVLVAAQGRWISTPEQATLYVGDGGVDTVHPTDAGHAYLAQRMFEAFSAVTEVPATVSVINGSGVEVSAFIEIQE